MLCSYSYILIYWKESIGVRDRGRSVGHFVASRIATETEQHVAYIFDSEALNISLPKIFYRKKLLVMMHSIH